MRTTKLINTINALVLLLILLSCNEMKTTDQQNKTIDSVAMNVETAVNVKTKYLDINGRKLAYRSVGEGTPFILCNRYRGNLDNWDPAFIDALARNFQVITFDYSGMGLSTGAPNEGMLKFAADVKDLTVGLGFSKIMLGGWSFGGAVAQTVMVQYPGMVSHGVLIGTNPPGKNEFAMEPIFFERSGILHNSFDDEIILFFEPEWEASRAAARRSHDRMAARTSDNDVLIPENLWGYYHQGFKDFIEDKIGAREKISTSKIPLLVIMGDHDICFPIKNWYALSRKLETAQLFVFPKSGHGPQHEFPEQSAELIESFYKHAVPPSAAI